MILGTTEDPRPTNARASSITPPAKEHTRAIARRRARRFSTSRENASRRSEAAAMGFVCLMGQPTFDNRAKPLYCTAEGKREGAVRPLPLKMICPTPTRCYSAGCSASSSLDLREARTRMKAITAAKTAAATAQGTHALLSAAASLPGCSAPLAKAVSSSSRLSS